MKRFPDQKIGDYLFAVKERGTEQKVMSLLILT
jgi:hypothetical protein